MSLSIDQCLQHEVSLFQLHEALIIETEKTIAYYRTEDKNMNEFLLKYHNRTMDSFVELCKKSRDDLKNKRDQSLYSAVRVIELEDKFSSLIKVLEECISEIIQSRRRIITSHFDRYKMTLARGEKTIEEFNNSSCHGNSYHGAGVNVYLDLCKHAYGDIELMKVEYLNLYDHDDVCQLQDKLCSVIKQLEKCQSSMISIQNLDHKTRMEMWESYNNASRKK